MISQRQNDSPKSRAVLRPNTLNSHEITASEGDASRPSQQLISLRDEYRLLIGQLRTGKISLEDVQKRIVLRQSDFLEFVACYRLFPELLTLQHELRSLGCDRL